MKRFLETAAVSVVIFGATLSGGTAQEADPAVGKPAAATDRPLRRQLVGQHRTSNPASRRQNTATAPRGAIKNASPIARRFSTPT